MSKVIGIGLGNLLKLKSTISKNQYKYKYKYNKINDFYIIDDKKKVVQFINKSNILINDNNHNDNLNVKTYDFKTLDTNLQVSCKHFSSKKEELHLH